VDDRAGKIGADDDHHIAGIGDFVTGPHDRAISSTTGLYRSTASWIPCRISAHKISMSSLAVHPDITLDTLIYIRGFSKG
jgi:hypothetical protein